MYQQLSKEKRAEPEEIKRAFITAYTMDAFKTLDQFTVQQLWQNETVDEFLADLHCQVWVVGEPLPECRMMCLYQGCRNVPESFSEHYRG